MALFTAVGTLARRTAKVLVHDLSRTSQRPYACFSFEKKNGDLQIQKAQEQIEALYSVGLDMEGLSKSLGLGRRTLERRFNTDFRKAPRANDFS